MVEIGAQKRKGGKLWFQVHLGTAMVIFIAISLILGINCSTETKFQTNEIPEFYERGFDVEIQGWPWGFRYHGQAKYTKWTDPKNWPADKWFIGALIGDVIVALTISGILGLLLELYLRNRTSERQV